MIPRVGSGCYCLEGVVGLGDVGVHCFGYWGFSKALKILLGDMLCSLFKWLFLVNSVYMQNLSIVLRWFPLFGIVEFASCLG